MTAFTLDTSGAVVSTSAPNNIHHTFWTDLDPFTQGYVEALLASVRGFRDPHYLKWDEATNCRTTRFVAFRDLAPETLAAILKDCEARLRHCPSEGVYPFLHHAQEAARWVRRNGERFWLWRQEGGRKNFPPLTVHLGDGGKVRFQ